jgi:DNA-binding phage protein
VAATVDVKPKLDAKKLRTAQALRDAASLSMAEIAEQGGVSQSPLYRNLCEAS